MKINRLIFLIVIVLLLQIGLVSPLDKFGIVPNLVVLSIVFLIFNTALWDALLVAGISGIILDAYSFTPFGFHSISGIIFVALLSWLLRQLFPKEEKLGLIALAIAAYYVIVICGYLLISLLFETYSYKLWDFTGIFFITRIALSIALYFPLSMFVRRVLRKSL